MEKILLSIVVPCYNEEKALPYFYEKITVVQSSLWERGVATELIFVDDGSRDNTALILPRMERANLFYISPLSVFCNKPRGIKPKGLRPHKLSGRVRLYYRGGG
jgi:cellulose synthase/poly-beta-1,6-N-acetylglucosamine synthase-like glycosyltransferase